MNAEAIMSIVRSIRDRSIYGENGGVCLDDIADRMEAAVKSNVDNNERILSIVNRMQERSRRLFVGDCEPTPGRFTVAAELARFAAELRLVMEGRGEETK